MAHLVSLHVLSLLFLSCITGLQYTLRIKSPEINQINTECFKIDKSNVTIQYSDSSEIFERNISLPGNISNIKIRWCENKILLSSKIITMTETEKYQSYVCDYIYDNSRYYHKCRSSKGLTWKMEFTKRSHITNLNVTDETSGCKQRVKINTYAYDYSRLFAYLNFTSQNITNIRLDNYGITNMILTNLSDGLKFNFTKKYSKIFELDKKLNWKMEFTTYSSIKGFTLTVDTNGCQGCNQKMTILKENITRYAYYNFRYFVYFNIESQNITNIIIHKIRINNIILTNLLDDEKSGCTPTNVSRVYSCKLNKWETTEKGLISTTGNPTKTPEILMAVYGIGGAEVFILLLIIVAGICLIRYYRRNKLYIREHKLKCLRRKMGQDTMQAVEDPTSIMIDNEFYSSSGVVDLSENRSHRTSATRLDDNIYAECTDVLSDDAEIEGPCCNPVKAISAQTVTHRDDEADIYAVPMKYKNRNHIQNETEDREHQDQSLQGEMGQDTMDTAENPTERSSQSVIMVENEIYESADGILESLPASATKTEDKDVK